MHHIYHTEGIILGSRKFGEAGKYFYILTRELGLVYAQAQGIRKLSSKLRFVLQEYNHARVNLVQGKNIWRVTTASKTNDLENIKRDPEKMRIFARASRLLKRLLPGEESSHKLFDDFLEGLKILEQAPVAILGKENADELRNIEIVLVLRLLHNLGYIGELPAEEKLIASTFDQEVLLTASENRSKILSTINKALRQTHL